jgi:hypothetical protein
MVTASTTHFSLSLPLQRHRTAPRSTSHPKTSTNTATSA